MNVGQIFGAGPIWSSRIWAVYAGERVYHDFTIRPRQNYHVYLTYSDGYFFGEYTEINAPFQKIKVGAVVCEPVYFSLKGVGCRTIS